MTRSENRVSNELAQHAMNYRNNRLKKGAANLHSNFESDLCPTTNENLPNIRQNE